MRLQQLTLPLLYRLLFPQVMRSYRRYKSHEALSRAQLEEVQLRELQKTLRYAYTNAPFYKQLWDAHGCSPDITALEELASFPLVDKQMLQGAIENKTIGLESWKERDLISQSTTGSSGSPFVYKENKSANLDKWGKDLAVHEWYDYALGDKKARFWRGELRRSMRRVLVDAIRSRRSFCIYDAAHPAETALTPERIDALLAQYERYNPRILEGFVSSLHIIANHIQRETGQPAVSLRSIVTGAEYLSDDAREAIGTAFGATVFNRYGGTEAGLIAHECRHQAEGNHYLHLSTDTNVIETVVDGLPVTQKPGEVVITSLQMRSVPMIRYRVGDIMTLDPTIECPCGLPYPLATSIEGRVNDVFVLPSGALVTTHLIQTLMKKAGFIDQYQIIQENEELVNVRYVPTQAPVDLELVQSAQKKLQAALEGLEITWKRVKTIPTGPGGKLHHCISRVDAAKKGTTR